MKSDTTPQGILLVLSGPMTWNSPELSIALKNNGFEEATPASFLPLLKEGKRLLIITDPDGLMQLLHHQDDCVAPAIISIFVDAPDAIIIKRIREKTPSVSQARIMAAAIKMKLERSRKHLYDNVDQSCCGNMGCLVTKIVTLVRRREIEIIAGR